MQEVARQSNGLYKLGPGTLYDNLRRLVDQGLVHELGSRVGDTDSRRRYYRLSAKGQDVIAAEVSRLEETLRAARVHLRRLKPERA